ncbi:MAG: PrgI family protein, partial [Actinomycetota bacterium]
MKLRLPANVDMPDRILAGLTLRQLLIVGGGVLVVWALYLAIGRSMGAAFAVVALPLGAAGWALATSTPQGIGIDRLAFLAARFLLMPRRLVLAPRGIAVSPKLSRRRLAPIDIPPFGVNEEGLADLGPHGFAVVCRASGINLSLRAEEEQRGLMAGFSRLLNSLDGPAQFLVRSDRFDLTGMLQAIEGGAAALPHPTLEAAARAHAAFLRDLGGRRDALRREVLICLREPRGSEEEAASRIGRRIQQAEALLRGFGIRLRRLTG